MCPLLLPGEKNEAAQHDLVSQSTGADWCAVLKVDLHALASGAHALAGKGTMEGVTGGSWVAKSLLRGGLSATSPQ